MGIMLAAPLAGYAAPMTEASATASAKKNHVAVQSTLKCLRPEEKDRLFRSDAVEKQIVALKEKLTAIDPKLYWMFSNCFPNTLDTTVHYSNDDGDDDTDLTHTRSPFGAFSSMIKA